MQVALYPHHHYLPFWHSPSQPNTMFNPNVMSKWTMHQEYSGTPTRKVGKHWVWPILMGLFEIDLSFMAHVSVFFHNGEVKIPHRVWVQITTLAMKTTTDGFPIVVDDQGVVQVQSLWGRDNGIDVYSPWGLLPDSISDTDKMLAITWQNFFLGVLRKAKARAREELAKAKVEAERYDVIK